MKLLYVWVLVLVAAAFQIAALRSRSSLQTRAIDWDTIFGVVATSHDTACVITNRHEPPASFTVIVPDRPASVPVSVLSRLPSCSDHVPASKESFFRITWDAFETPELGIAVLRPRVRVGPGVKTDLDGNRVLESYRTCTSNEGVHLTVWSGEPLKSTRLWHYYYYLGYDVEPSCQEADFQSD